VLFEFSQENLVYRLVFQRFFVGDSKVVCRDGGFLGIGEKDKNVAGNIFYCSTLLS
jgi:hypothetical protein